MLFKHSAPTTANTWRPPAAMGLLATAILYTTLPALAVANGLPTGGHFSLGKGFISTNNPDLTIVTQSTSDAVIMWSTFDIDKGKSVMFSVPNGGATLNFIEGPASQINGRLSSSGKLFLVNPNGMLFGQGASVNVRSLVASSHRISSDDFMAGKLSFTQGGTGTVSNAGKIEVLGTGGYVVLASGGDVSNSGTIWVPGGSIQMVSADKFTLSLPTSNPFLNVMVDGPASGAKVSNSGVLFGGAINLQSTKGVVSLADTSTVQAYGIRDLKSDDLVKISGNGINLGGRIHSEGNVALSSKGITQVKGAALSAGKNVYINSSDSLHIGNSTLQAAGGKVSLSSQSRVSMDRAKINTGHGNIEIAGYATGQNLSESTAAVSVNHSTLSASSGNQAEGEVRLVGFAHEAHNTDEAGVSLKNSELRANTTRLIGFGNKSLDIDTSILNAGEVVLQGGAQLTGPGGGQIGMYGSTVQSKGDIKFEGGAAVAVSTATLSAGRHIEVKSADSVQISSSNINVKTGNIGLKSKGAVVLTQSTLSSDAGQITLEANGIGHLVGTTLSANKNINVDAKNSLHIDDSAVHTTRGSISLASESRTSLNRSKLIADEGDVSVRGFARGHQYASSKAAVHIDHSEINIGGKAGEKGNLHLSGFVADTINASETGIAVKNSTLQANGVQMHGQGEKSINIDASTFSARDILINGGTGAKNGHIEFNASSLNSESGIKIKNAASGEFHTTSLTANNNIEVSADNSIGLYNATLTANSGNIGIYAKGPIESRYSKYTTPQGNISLSNSALGASSPGTQTGISIQGSTFTAVSQDSKKGIVQINGTGVQQGVGLSGSTLNSNRIEVTGKGLTGSHFASSDLNAKDILFNGQSSTGTGLTMLGGTLVATNGITLSGVSEHGTGVEFGQLPTLFTSPDVHVTGAGKVDGIKFQRPFSTANATFVSNGQVIKPPAPSK